MRDARDAFDAAIRWHKAGKMAAPLSGSVYYTQTILNELNTAIELLKRVQPDGPNICEEFLANHSEAPY